MVADAPVAADIAVLLAGDELGERMTTAARLVESNLVPQVLVSGPSGPYGTWESDLAIEWAVRQGKTREWFVPRRMTADSTAEEAAVLVRWLRDRNIKRIDLVTSNYHTRRAGAIWREHAPDLEIHVVAAPCKDFDPEHWWLSRRGKKIFAFEWQKTIGRIFGL